MALKITLKPGERMIIGGAVITNAGSSCSLLIENQVPILRRKEILTEQEADTPCKRIYLSIQLMYIDEKNLSIYHARYWESVNRLIEAAPGLRKTMEEISRKILAGAYYPALKLAGNLIGLEEDLLKKCKDIR